MGSAWLSPSSHAPAIFTLTWRHIESSEPIWLEPLILFSLVLLAYRPDQTHKQQKGATVRCCRDSKKPWNEPTGTMTTRHA